MISKELQKIIEIICTQGEHNFLDATTEEKIINFETKYNIKLPVKYKEWLLFSDGGEIFLPAGVQFYGIEHNPIIDTEGNNRPGADYIVIGALSSGDPIVFKTGEEQISIYNLEDDRIEDDEKYKNFLCFLEDIYNILGI